MCASSAPYYLPSISACRFENPTPHLVGSGTFRSVGGGLIFPRRHRFFRQSLASKSAWAKAEARACKPLFRDSHPSARILLVNIQHQQAHYKNQTMTTMTNSSDGRCFRPPNLNRTITRGRGAGAGWVDHRPRVILNAYTGEIFQVPGKLGSEQSILDVLFVIWLLC